MWAYRPPPAERGEQEPLGFDLPPTIDETPPWNLNSQQFGQRENIMWHSSRSDLLDPQQQNELHVGSKKSALDRGNRFLHAVEVKPDFMGNSTDDLLTDDAANALGDENYDSVYGIDESGFDGGRDSTSEEFYAFQRGDAGFYYENVIEDPGSVSAILPGPQAYDTYASHAEAAVRSGERVHPEAKYVVDRARQRRLSPPDPKRPPVPRDRALAPETHDPLWSDNDPDALFNTAGLSDQGRAMFHDNDVSMGTGLVKRRRGEPSRLTSFSQPRLFNRSGGY